MLVQGLTSIMGWWTRTMSWLTQTDTDITLIRFLNTLLFCNLFCKTSSCRQDGWKWCLQWLHRQWVVCQTRRLTWFRHWVDAMWCSQAVPRGAPAPISHRLSWTTTRQKNENVRWAGSLKCNNVTSSAPARHMKGLFLHQSRHATGEVYFFFISYVTPH